ncbi:hypothetical protein V498_07163 [Pseudogymnoascus sp. VKM F-4517 (FW-2822)]|nr:hypothetical protein V498_07163 [Pseudogymnoascus sp. VKM F-4517 (FW-2822)]
MGLVYMNSTAEMNKKPTTLERRVEERERERERVGDVEKEWDLRVERGRQGAGSGRRGGGGGVYGDMYPGAQKAATTVSEWGGCQGPIRSLGIIPGQDTPGFSRGDRRQRKTHGGRDLCRGGLGAEKKKRRKGKDTKNHPGPQEELSIVPSRSRRNTLTNRYTTLTTVSTYEYPMARTAKRHATKNLEF